MTAETEHVLDSEEAGGRVIRGGGLRAAGYVGGLLVGLISTPLMVRHLGPVDYGAFVTVASLLFIVAGITEGGLGNLGVREYATLDPQGRRHLLSSLLGLRVLLTAIGLAGALAFALIAGYRRVLVEGVLLAGCGLLLTTLQNTFTVPLQSHLRLGWLAGLDFIRQVATAALMIALVVAGAALLPFYGVALATAALALGITAWLVRSEAVLPAVDLRQWRWLLGQTTIYAAATALGVVYFQVAIVSMSILSTATETGFYGLAFRIIDLANGVPWLLATSIFPVLARAAHVDAARLRYAMARLFEVALIVGGWFSLSIIVGAPFAVDFVGGPKFSPQSTEVLRILGAGTVFTFLIASWSFGLLSLRRHRALLLANGFAFVLGVGLCLALIPSHGARGGAVAAAGLEVALACAYAVALRGAGMVPPLGVVPRWALALGAALATGLLLPVHVVIATIVAGLVYFALLLVLRTIPSEIFDALRLRALRRFAARPGG